MVNRPPWKTDVTGRAQFDWKFGRPTAAGAGAPMKVNFKFAGPEVEGFGYRAESVKAQGVYVAPDLKFDASGVGYGAAATTRASFHFPAAGAMSYALADESPQHSPPSRHRKPRIRRMGLGIRDRSPGQPLFWALAGLEARPD